MREPNHKSRLALVAAAAISLSVMTASIGVGEAAVGSSARGRASLATFAGSWIGHGRSMTISRKGMANESIDSGCCSHVIDVHYELSHPRGSGKKATATAVVTFVKVSDPDSFSSQRPAPKVGQKTTFRRNGSVLTEPLLDITYCTPAAQAKSICGA
jgi:hypothetical protein